MFVYLSKITVCSTHCTKEPLTKNIPCSTLTAQPVTVAEVAFNVAEMTSAKYASITPLEEIDSPSVNSFVALSEAVLVYLTNKVSGSVLVATA